MEHLSDHVGFLRTKTFDGVCRWEQCGCVKATRGALISHLLVHCHVVNYTCSCGKGFKRKHDFNIHQSNCKKMAGIVSQLQLKLKQDKKRRNSQK